MSSRAELMNKKLERHRRVAHHGGATRRSTRCRLFNFIRLYGEGHRRFSRHFYGADIVAVPRHWAERATNCKEVQTLGKFQ